MFVVVTLTIDGRQLNIPHIIVTNRIKYR